MRIGIVCKEPTLAETIRTFFVVHKKHAHYTLEEALNYRFLEHLGYETQIHPQKEFLQTWFDLLHLFIDEAYLAKDTVNRTWNLENVLVTGMRNRAELDVLHNNSFLLCHIGVYNIKSPLDIYLNYDYRISNPSHVSLFLELNKMFKSFKQ